MVTSALNMSRTLSPTIRTTVGTSKFLDMASPTLLMMASSAARSSVILSRLWVSSNRRAFSSATPMLDATVVNKRTSESLKAFSLSKLLMLTNPRTWFPVMIGTATRDFSLSVPSKVGASISAERRSISSLMTNTWRVSMTYFASPVKGRGSRWIRSPCSFR